MTEPMTRYDVAIDWDGVIYQYLTPIGDGPASAMPDAPVPGAIEWLEALHRAGLSMVIHSTRLSVSDFDGVFDAMRAYLAEHGCAAEVIDGLDLWIHYGKPRARVYVDDRGFRFDGRFPDPAELVALDVWNRVDRDAARGRPPQVRHLRSAYSKAQRRVEQPEIVTHGTGADEVLPAGRCSDDAILVLSRRAGVGTRVAYHPETFVPSDGRWRGANGHYLGGLTASDRWMVIDPTARADRPDGPDDIAETRRLLGNPPADWPLARKVKTVMMEREHAHEGAMALRGAVRALMKSTGVDLLPGDDMAAAVRHIAERGGFTWDGKY